MASQHVLCTGQGNGCTLRYPEEGKATRASLLNMCWCWGSRELGFQGISAEGTSKSLGVRSEAMKEVVGEGEGWEMN